MKIFDRYVFKNLGFATVFVAIILAVVILLTQSLKFLELVINSGADSWSFWVLTFLALPRFFEVILPLSLMASVLFVYNRMTIDSEMVVIRAGGYSPLNLARPAILLSLIVTIFLWGMTMYVAPKSLSNMNRLRQVVKAQVSTMMLRDGVFNRAGKGMTVYVSERGEMGELKGLMIHDARDKIKPPSTVFAKRGVVVSGENSNQIVVYEGARQTFDVQTRVLQSLNFSRYTIDLPESNPVVKGWSSPDERTILELLNPDLEVKRDRDAAQRFLVETHRRITAPLMAIVFTLIACAALLLGPLDRRGQSKRIMLAVGMTAILQGLFLSVSNIARNNEVGIVMMYVCVFAPMIFSVAILSTRGERLRAFLFRRPLKNSQSEARI